VKLGSTLGKISRLENTPTGVWGGVRLAYEQGVRL
jgi:hypothetical protein